MNELKLIIQILKDIEYLSSNEYTKNRDDVMRRLEINALSIEALGHCDTLLRKVRRLKQQ
jgi:hypothetical protein